MPPVVAPVIAAIVPTMAAQQHHTKEEEEGVSFVDDKDTYDMSKVAGARQVG